MALGRRPVRAPCGEALADTALEVIIELRAPPKLLFAGEDAHVPHGKLIRFRLGAGDRLGITVQAKVPGGTLKTRPVQLDVDFEPEVEERHEPCERLLADALAGDHRRFAREDTLEQAWRIVGPLLDDDEPPVYPYGSWGPREADRLPAEVLSSRCRRAGAVLISKLRPAPGATAGAWRDLRRPGSERCQA